MNKKLCKLKKLLGKDLKKYVKHVKEPRFVCGTCGRVANKKGLICNPVKIKP
jgi:hypothetical protein